MENKRIPKVVYWVASLVILFIVYTIAHAHFEIWLRAEPIHLIGEKTNNLNLVETKNLYKNYSLSEQLKALVVAIGISLSTMLIIIYYKNQFIKALFVFLDGAVVYLFLGFDYTFWWKWGSLIYGSYILLIVYFVGSIASEFINRMSEEPEKPKESELQPLKYKINELIIAQNTIDKEFRFVMDRDNQIKEVNRKIAARKQKLYRDGQDWKTDDETLKLISEKKNL